MVTFSFYIIIVLANMTFKSANIIFHNSCFFDIYGYRRSTPRNFKVSHARHLFCYDDRKSAVYHISVHYSRMYAMRTSCSLLLKIFFYILSGIGFFHFGNFLRCSFGDHSSAAVSTFRSHIDDIISSLDDIQIVFNDDYGITSI